MAWQGNWRFCDEVIRVDDLALKGTEFGQRVAFATHLCVLAHICHEALPGLCEQARLCWAGRVEEEEVYRMEEEEEQMVIFVYASLPEYSSGKSPLLPCMLS